MYGPPLWKNNITIRRGNAFSSSEYYLFLQKDNESKSGHDSKQDVYIGYGMTDV